VDLAGSLTFSNQKPCPESSLNYRISGEVSVSLNAGIDLWGIWGVNLGTLGLKIGAATHRSQCKQVNDEGRRRRRWWSRRRTYYTCSDVCEPNVFGEMWLQVSVWVAGAKLAARGEYIFSTKRFIVTIYVNYYLGWSGWQTAFNKQVADTR